MTDRGLFLDEEMENNSCLLADVERAKASLRGAMPILRASVCVLLSTVLGCVSPNRYREVRDERDNLRTTVSQIKAEKDLLTHDLDALQSEDTAAALVLALRGQLKSASDRASQLEQTLDSMANTNDRLSKRVDSLEQRLSREKKNGRELSAALDECRSAAQTLIQQQVRGTVYPGVGGGHWVRKKIGTGEYVVLEDGSLWQISSIDRIDSMLWLPTEEIIVLDNPSGFLPYVLVNTDAGDRVEAKCVGAE